ncbi:MAG: DNA primase [Dehalococcoidia bacterium]
MSTIDEVKARLDIVETVGGYVPTLKKSGRRYKALCPFHTERTPSFMVDPARGSWHCFGACSTGGDVIEFVRRIEHLEFPDALRRCAERAGVELRPRSRREQEQREEHERLLRANEAAAVFFRAALGGPDGEYARRYLDERGVDAETQEVWQLGYAPAGWRGLREHLEARGFEVADLLAAGLVVEPDGGGEPYDRFRDRLIFPTRDVNGRMIGFGARALKPEDEPKYLNTPQTPLFDKSGTLYGLGRAAETARREDRLVVVEGYMDVIASHQFGIENVVASMGTALTEKQMNLAKRVTANIVLALDADNAGSEATLRGVEVVANTADRRTVATVDWRGLVGYQDVLQADIRVVTMPDGEDPDSLVRADPERFRTLIDESKPVTDHLFDAVGAQTDAANPRSRSRAVDALAPTVAAIVDPVVRAHYVQRLARLGQVDERVIVSRFARPHDPSGPAPVASGAEVRRQTRGPAAEALDGESQLLQLLLLRDDARAAGKEVDEDTFEESVNRRLFAAWNERADLDQRLDELDDDVRERFVQLREPPAEWLDPLYLESRYVEGMVRQIAAELRLRRASARLRPAAVEQAEEVRTFRTAEGEGAAVVLQAAVQATVEGSVPAEVADKATELAAEFAEVSERQRALTREYQTLRGQRTPSGDADPGDPEEGEK